MQYRREYSFSLQKVIVVIPLFFIGVILLDYSDWKACPWLDNNSTQYIEIVSIAIDTIFNTLIVGFCLFVSRGWKVVKSHFEREELSRITLVVGVFYLVYSAYFIASDIESLRVIIIIALTVMYAIVLLFWFSNWYFNLKAINHHISISRFSQVVITALKLKRYLMRWFMLLSTLFFANKIVYTLTYDFIKNNFTWRWLLVVNLFTQVIIIGTMIWVLRTRKWMEFFTVDILMPGQNDPNADQNVVVADVLIAEVPKLWVLDHKSNKEKSDIIWNKQQVTKSKKIAKCLNCEQALLLNYSQTKWDEIDENDSSAIRGLIYESTQLAIPEPASDEDE